MNVLMSLAVVGAMAIGEWSEAGLVAFLFGLGTVLQAATLDRTRRAITGLMELAPPVATVSRDGVEADVPVAEIAVGGLLLVPRTRRLGAGAAVALFLAVFPANINLVRMWWNKPLPMKLGAIARLPFQVPMIVSALKIRRNAPV